MLHCWLPTDANRNVRALVYPKGATYKVRGYSFISSANDYEQLSLFQASCRINNRTFCLTIAKLRYTYSVMSAV